MEPIALDTRVALVENNIVALSRWAAQFRKRILAHLPARSAGADSEEVYWWTVNTLLGADREPTLWDGRGLRLCEFCHDPGHHGSDCPLTPKASDRATAEAGRELARDFEFLDAAKEFVEEGSCVAETGYAPAPYTGRHALTHMGAELILDRQAEVIRQARERIASLESQLERALEEISDERARQISSREMGTLRAMVDLGARPDESIAQAAERVTLELAAERAEVARLTTLAGECLRGLHTERMATQLSDLAAAYSELGETRQLADAYRANAEKWEAAAGRFKAELVTLQREVEAAGAWRVARDQVIELAIKLHGSIRRPQTPTATAGGCLAEAERGGYPAGPLFDQPQGILSAFTCPSCLHDAGHAPGCLRDPETPISGIKAPDTEQGRPPVATESDDRHPRQDGGTPEIADAPQRRVGSLGALLSDGPGKDSRFLRGGLAHGEIGAKTPRGGGPEPQEAPSSVDDGATSSYVYDGRSLRLKGVWCEACAMEHPSGLTHQRR